MKFKVEREECKGIPAKHNSIYGSAPKSRKNKLKKFCQLVFKGGMERERAEAYQLIAQTCGVTVYEFTVNAYGCIRKKSIHRVMVRGG